VRGIELTLRNALEPWHVMGEEGAPGGTVRYVDSSLERIEVKVTGLNESRYVVTVNGRALPLQPTGTVGEFVAGVRYKAWNPPSALHPTIGVHAPLTFDIVDTWMKRSWAAASTTWPTRAGATTTPSRSTPTRPKAAAWRASSAWATRQMRWADGRQPEFPFTWTFGAPTPCASPLGNVTIGDDKRPIRSTPFLAAPGPCRSGGSFGAACCRRPLFARSRWIHPCPWAVSFENPEPPRRNLERQVRDNGVTYNVYADAGGPQRPWSLDLFPLIISPESWQHRSRRAAAHALLDR
jgi:hypothetical protein